LKEVFGDCEPDRVSGSSLRLNEHTYGEILQAIPLLAFQIGKTLIAYMVPI